METDIAIIKGRQHTDTRGTICFVNDFDMSLVKRMYMISHSDTSVERGWRGHRLEKRWFFVVAGGFKLSLVKIDNWEAPDKDLEVYHFILHANQPCVMYVPEGYASCFKAETKHSALMVYADHGIDHAKLDDYLYPVDYFNNA